jgi:predicted dithiol-disulfide oxidoreductase (DUF899 family)
MVHEMIDGTYRQTNLANESPEYLAQREELRLAEIELMKQRERCAELRRALPKGATIADYEFLEGPASLDDGDTPTKTVRLSELFTRPDRSLVIYQMMYGKKQVKPCPMCTAWIDSWNGVAHHLAQNIDVAIVAAAEPASLRSFARERGWDKLRLLSAGEAPLNTTSAAKTRPEIRTRRFQFSLETVMARCTIFTVSIQGWPKRSKNAALMSGIRFGMSWT